jgi:zinc-finger protein CreA/MIG
MSNNVASPVYGKRSSASYSPASSHEPPPLSSPPSLEVANRAYSMSTPPDSPPPLAHATLPATHRPPVDSHSHHSHSRSSSSPELPYSPHNQPQPHSHSHSHSHSHLVGMPNMNGHVASSYPYRSGTATYQEQSQGTFTYVHTTPIPHSSGPGGNLNGHGMHANSFSYPSSHGYDNIHQSPHHTPSPPMSAMSSRHSISHISHPHSHSNGQRSSGGPPSPESTNSVASHNSHTTSGPATPAYPPPPYSDGHHYGVAMESSPELPSLNGGHLNSHGQLVHPGYPSLMQQQNSVPSNRFASPPPILAPIYSDRDNGTGSARGDQHQRMPPYVHQSQTISNDYQYSQAQMGSGHPTWKSDSGMRNKGIGALIL